MELQNGSWRAIELGGRYKGSYTFVSEEDFWYLNRFKWSVNRRYAYNTKLGKMHRVIAERMGLDLSNEIDHRDRDTLNNCRSNLRPATHTENCRNRNIRSDNSSGVPGVYFHKQKQKWEARIKISGKYKYLGAFKTLEEAKEARLKAEKEYYGAFAPIHAPKE